MTDCPNAEIRDRLPDLLHDRLDASERAAVMAHVDACAECRAELELLRDVQRTLMARTPRVNVGAIVAALPKPGARSHDAGVVSLGERRGASWSHWRAAAAITFLAVGAGAASFAIARKSGGGSASSPGTSVVAERPAQRGDSAPIAPESVANRIVASTQAAVPGGSQPNSGRSANVPAADNETLAENGGGDQADVGESSRLSNLSNRQLQALLQDIDRMPAVPVPDAEPASLKVEVKTTTASPGGT